MRTTLLLLLLSVSFNLSSQISEIRGVITDANNDPIDFANVYVEGTLEGTTPDADGKFYLKIKAKDTITLIVSSIGFKTYKKTDHINYFNDVKIVLHSDETILDDVVIMAGNYNVLSASTLEGRSAVD